MIQVTVISNGQLVEKTIKKRIEAAHEKTHKDTGQFSLDG
jgi:hypothetical protein